MSIPVPNIPTNNLYKFTSVTGVLILLLSIGSYVYFKVDLSFKNISFQSDINTFRVEYEQLNEEKLNMKIELQAALAKLPKDIREHYDIMKKIGEISQTDTFKVEFAFSVTNNPELIDKFSDVMKELYKYNQNRLSFDKNIQLKEKQDELKLIEEWLKKLNIIALVGIIIGVGLSVYGFYCWWIRVQRYQDRILKTEASKLTKKE